MCVNLPVDLKFAFEDFYLVLFCFFRFSGTHLYAFGSVVAQQNKMVMILPEEAQLWTTPQKRIAAAQFK